MKQKTFEFDDVLAARFGEFCRTRMLVEKRVAAAALLWFMEQDADEREKVMLLYEKWCAESGSSAATDLGIAASGGTGRVSPSRKKRTR